MEKSFSLMLMGIFMVRRVNVFDKKNSIKSIFFFKKLIKFQKYLLLKVIFVMHYYKTFSFSCPNLNYFHRWLSMNLSSRKFQGFVGNY